MNRLEGKQRKFLIRANLILKTLLENEFHKIKKPVFALLLPFEAKSNGFWAKVFKELFQNLDLEAVVFPFKSMQKRFPVRLDKNLIKNAPDFIIEFNPNAKYLLNYSDDQIKELLRHELLHIELKEPLFCPDNISLPKYDHSIKFIKVALSREIFVHANNIMNHIDSLTFKECAEWIKYNFEHGGPKARKHIKKLFLSSPKQKNQREVKNESREKSCL